MEQIFKRLGHLGEVHMVDPEATHTFCNIRADGPNFSIVTPVEIAPRADPTLCPDCKAIYDERGKAEEAEASE